MAANITLPGDETNNTLICSEQWMEIFVITNDYQKKKHKQGMNKLHKNINRKIWELEIKYTNIIQNHRKDKKETTLTTYMP